MAWVAVGGHEWSSIIYAHPGALQYDGVRPAGAATDNGTLQQHDTFCSCMQYLRYGCGSSGCSQRTVLSPACPSPVTAPARGLNAR